MSQNNKNNNSLPSDRLLLPFLSSRNQLDFLNFSLNSNELLQMSISNKKSFYQIKQENLRNLIMNAIQPIKKKKKTKSIRRGFELFFRMRGREEEEDLEEEVEGEEEGEEGPE